MTNAETDKEIARIRRTNNRDELSDLKELIQNFKLMRRLTNELCRTTQTKHLEDYREMMQRIRVLISNGTKNTSVPMIVEFYNNCSRHNHMPVITPYDMNIYLQVLCNEAKVLNKKLPFVHRVAFGKTSYVKLIGIAALCAMGIYYVIQLFQ